VKIKDFDFIDNIENISCGEGKYDVEINKETEFKHCIKSTGELKGKKLTLGAIVELSDLTKKRSWFQRTSPLRRPQSTRSSLQ